MVITADVLGVVLPVAVGAYRIVRKRDDRFAWLLLAAGGLWALTTLSHSTGSTAYSVGRVAAWAFDLLTVYLMLSFPQGRVTSRADRAVVAAAGLAFALLYMPTVLLAQFPTPNPWATCGADCPQNAFALTSSTPAFVDGPLRSLRETLTALIFAAVAVLLVRRVRGAGPLMRRLVGPVAVVAVFRGIAVAVYFVARRASPSSEAAEVLGYIYLFTLPAISLTFAAGLLGQRLFVANALERLTLGLRQHATPTELRGAMASALRDPTLRIVYWFGGDPGRWVDETGWPIKAPEEEDGRTVTEVSADGRRLAAIVHDVELMRDAALVRAATSYALTALENERLVRQLQSSLQELSESRTRLVAVADGERRKIERDLHDGAQQRLVALRVKLDLAAERIEDDAPDAASAVRELEGEVDAAIDEVRSFARGIYPSLLAERGLSEALRAAGRSAPLPTTVDTAGVARHRPEIEGTVYFACMEALQNAAKHARDASRVAISVVQDGQLRFEVSDDGAGFDANETAYGAGLTNLRDRLGAVGGTLEVESAPGSGTRVRGVIPVD